MRALLGFGLENKHSTAFFLVALTAGLLLTRQRRMLGSKFFWMAALLVALIALPDHHEIVKRATARAPVKLAIPNEPLARTTQ